MQEVRGRRRGVKERLVSWHLCVEEEAEDATMQVRSMCSREAPPGSCSI